MATTAGTATFEILVASPAAVVSAALWPPSADWRMNGFTLANAPSASLM
jgi:hypothetical protein